MVNSSSNINDRIIYENSSANTQTNMNNLQSHKPQLKQNKFHDNYEIGNTSFKKNKH